MMPHHLADHVMAGRHVPGILILSDELGIGGNIEELRLIAGASRMEEYQDRIVQLPLT